ncbi:MAG TPA: tetratricopeptide repeat protein [Candidatus Sulfotelmatobacter sp.]
MVKLRLVLAAALILSTSAFGQDTPDEPFNLALPEHKGQLQWSAPGFTVIQSSAKPGGSEIGIRGKDKAGRIFFLGFLFLFPEQAPITSTKCRAGVLDPEKKDNPTLKVLTVSEDARGSGPPLALASYTAQGGNGKTAYMIRGFLAGGDVCGDLEFYSDSPIGADDSVRINQILAGYRLDEGYVPRLKDIFVYAQILYNSHMFKAAAPIFELALAKLREQPKGQGDVQTMRRVLTDQAGMAYGISGDIPKARAIFEKAILDDPDYPLYYYNLACADAEEKNLAGARSHLQMAFSKKANTLPGESMPDPTKDDSFLPYRNNKGFWTFVESLRNNP